MPPIIFVDSNNIFILKHFSNRNGYKLWCNTVNNYNDSLCNKVLDPNYIYISTPYSVSSQPYCAALNTMDYLHIIVLIDCGVRNSIYYKLVEYLDGHKLMKNQKIVLITNNRMLKFENCSYIHYIEKENACSNTFLLYQYVDTYINIYKNTNLLVTPKDVGETIRNTRKTSIYNKPQYNKFLFDLYDINK